MLDNIRKLLRCLRSSNRAEVLTVFAGVAGAGVIALEATSTALQVAVVHLHFLNLAFGTVPLSAGQWCVCVAMSSGVLWFSGGRKPL